MILLSCVYSKLHHNSLLAKIDEHANQYSTLTLKTGAVLILSIFKCVASVLLVTKTMCVLTKCHLNTGFYTGTLPFNTVGDSIDTLQYLDSNRPPGSTWTTWNTSPLSSLWSHTFSTYASSGGLLIVYTVKASL